MAQNRSHAVMAQRAEARDSLDFFPTPPWATRALVEHVLIGGGERRDTRDRAVIVTNPPFRLAQQFVLRGLEIATAGVAMLVRTVFLESAARYRAASPEAASPRKRAQRRAWGDWWRRVRRRPGLDAWATVPAVVLDPFGGSGTTALAAARLGRDAVLIELNPDYAALAETRLRAALVPFDGYRPANAETCGMPLFAKDENFAATAELTAR